MEVDGELLGLGLEKGPGIGLRMRLWKSNSRIVLCWVAIFLD